MVSYNTYLTVWNSWDYYNLSPPTKLGKSGRKTVRAWMGLKVSRDVALGVILVILAASGASDRELGIICSVIAWCIFVDTVTMAANSNGGFYHRMRVGIHSSMATSLAISSTQHLYAPRLKRAWIFQQYDPRLPFLVAV
jgi:hypothetical protein